MKITFVGAAHEVTGSCHYLEAAGKHILIDCGMEQGVNIYENCEIPVEEAKIDYVFLTHAHIDHSGMLPLLYAKGFRGQIYTTDATLDLCSIMLRDSAHIQMQEAEWKNRKARRSPGAPIIEPIYTMEDADATIKRIKACHYDTMEDISEGVKIRFTDIGHLLGSASIEVWLTEDDITKKIVFSGDIGNINQPLIRDPRKTLAADYVVMESTYGDRIHSKEQVDYVAELTTILQETFDKGGNVIIPSFAVGRTQEMLYFFRKIKEDKLIKGHSDFTVFVDSPLAVAATSIFQQNIDHCFDEEAMELVHKGINPISFKGLRLSITSDESRAINFESRPAVILSASGMCEAGRIRHHLKHNLWKREATILFVGYQAIGTLGRAIAEGVKEVKLFGETIEIRAKIVKLAGMSGHADKNGLLEWIDGFEEKPERVFVVHGEDDICDKFVDCLEQEHGHCAFAPFSGTTFDLLTNTCTVEKDGIPYLKKYKGVSDVWNRLMAAGKRLLVVIGKSKDRSNKDNAKFADQVNSLCDKWD